MNHPSRTVSGASGHLPVPAIVFRLQAFVMAILVVSGTGCDRPFIDVAEPEIEILEPDPDRIVTASRIDVAVRASSFRPIDRVEVEGQPMDFNPSARTWTRAVDLSPGVNTLAITAFDIENVAGTDTAVVVYLPFSFSLSPAVLPASRGNHAAILMANGDVLVTGGSLTPGGEAFGQAATFSPGGFSFATLSESMQHRRLGHTMSNMPDGRVLIMGGADRGLIRDVLSLVEEPEMFDPATGSFHTLPVDGDPIRRAEHTASARITSSGLVIDLFGGLGDVRYRPAPELGVRGDIRSFLFRNDSLIALTSGVGGFLSDPISGHTQTSLSGGSGFDFDRFVIHGTFFGQGFFETTSFTVDFADPLGLLPIDVSAPLTPRTQHAAAPLAPGLVATFGGAQGIAEAAVGSVEIFVDQTDRFMTLPAQSPFLFRYRHTATKLADNRILLLGGFDANGNSLSLVEYFVFSAQQSGE